MSYCYQWLIGIILIFLSLLVLKSILPKSPNSVKLPLLYLIIFLITGLSVPFIIFRPRDYRNLLIPTAITCKFGEYLGYNIKVRGQENIQPNHGSILILNHQSVIDLLVIAHLWPLIGRATVIAKKEIMYFPGLGQFLWLGGILFIDRKKRTKAINKMNQVSHAIKEEHAKILVFPEGTRNLQTTLLPFKKGCFHLALQNQCPIQPVTVSQYKFLTNKSQPGINDIIINILEEMSTEDVTVDNLGDFIDKCQNIMQSECIRLNEELENKNKICDDKKIK